MHVRWTRLSYGEDQYSCDPHTLVVDLSTIFTLTHTFTFEGPSIRFFFFFHLTVLPVSRFMRSDVKINLLVKLLSPKGGELNHFFFFFHTDLVLSGDESMNQVRNSKSWINDLCLAWSNMIDRLGSWLLLCIKIYIIYKWLRTEEKNWVFSKDIILCNTLKVIPSDQFNKTFFKSNECILP